MCFNRAKRALRGVTAHTWLSTLVALAMVLASAGRAYADTWQAGDLVTYEQYDWGDFGSSAGQLLSNTYFNVFAATSQTFEVGLQTPSGFSIIFDNPTSVLAFLPAAGGPAALDGDYIDPSSTPAGDFGGDVVALALNVAYSDAGLLGGTSSTLFGDLVLTNLTTLPLLNGMTVRDFLALDNELLGGAPAFTALTRSRALRRH